MCVCVCEGVTQHTHSQHTHTLPPPLSLCAVAEHFHCFPPSAFALVPRARPQVPGVRSRVDPQSIDCGAFIGDHTKDEVVQMLADKREGTFCVFGIAHDDTQLFLALAANVNVLMRFVLWGHC